jgi:hypothetical protein
MRLHEVWSRLALYYAVFHYVIIVFLITWASERTQDGLKAWVVWCTSGGATGISQGYLSPGPISESDKTVQGCPVRSCVPKELSCFQRGAAFQGSPVVKLKVLRAP